MSQARNESGFIIYIVFFLLLGGLSVTLWLATMPPVPMLQGEVTANRVDVSSRVPGRIAKLVVEAGDVIEKGSVIAELENPQLLTILFAAQEAENVAKADFARVISTRPETIEARRADLAAADADVQLYQAAYGRQAQLIKSGNTPQSRFDEATRNLEAASRKREAALSALHLAVAGASVEEKALAAAQVKQAKATLAQHQADVAELKIKAPISGQVTSRIAEPGENFNAGSPIYSIIDLSDIWFTFNVREDLLASLRVGDAFNVTVPALGSKVLKVRVAMINVQGQFATWRATKATGDFDLRTFEVRARTDQPVEGLRPGMSAIATSLREAD